MPGIANTIVVVVVGVVITSGYGSVDGSDECNESPEGTLVKLGATSVVNAKGWVGMPLPDEPYNSLENNWKPHTTLTTKNIWTHNTRIMPAPNTTMEQPNEHIGNNLAN